MSQTTIQWTDRTWNPIRGCSPISPGCKHCYAMRQAARFCRPPGDNLLGQLARPADPFHGFVNKVNGHPAWTGKVELIESKMEEPLHWKKPCRVFVDSMSDLFHESLSVFDIKAVFDVMKRAHWHTFQILTKRENNMLEVCRWLKENWDDEYPLFNVWLGVSVESRSYLHRIDLLRETPAAIRFVSLEPLLEDIGEINLKGIDWAIIGGESGPGARPFDVQWPMDLIPQCRRDGAAPFVKQLGADPWWSGDGDHGPNLWNRLFLNNSHGGDPSEWPEPFPREFPRGTTATNTVPTRGRVAKP